MHYRSSQPAVGLDAIKLLVSHKRIEVFDTCGNGEGHAEGAPALPASYRTAKARFMMTSGGAGAGMATKSKLGSLVRF